MNFLPMVPTSNLLNEIASTGSLPDAQLLFYAVAATLVAGLWTLGRFTLGAHPC